MKLFNKVSILFASLALVMGAGLVGSNDAKEVKAEKIIDVITADKLKATSTSYTDFSGVSFSSSAVYAGNNAKNNVGAIQLRSSSSNSGIVSTASGGTLKSISIVVSSGTKTLDIYGANSAYSSASDLYKTTTQGTKLGSLSSTGTFNFPNDVTYQFIGLRSNSGAIYLSSIEISWSNASLDDPTPIINLINNIGTVTYDGDCFGRITAARDAYNAASDEVKQGVTNYQTLLDAENKYSKLKLDNDKKEVEEAEALVNDLPSVDEITDLSRKTEIEEAEAAYLALTEDQKKLYNATILDKLNKLIAKIEELDPSNEVLFDFTKSGSDASSLLDTPQKINGIEVKTIANGTNLSNSTQNPIRLYKNSSIEFSAKENIKTIKSIKVVIDTSKTVNNTLKATVSPSCDVSKTSADVVTFTPNSNTLKVTMTFSEDQARWQSVEVLYEKDSVETFASEWAAMRTDGGANGICEFLKSGTEKRDTLDYMLARFDNLTNSDELANYNDGDNETSILDSINYVKNIINGEQKTDGDYGINSGVIITSNYSIDSTSLIALFALLGIGAISAYYFIEKKKLSK